MVTVLAEFHGGIYCLKKALLVDAGNDEISLVDSLWTFGTCADADGGEWMTYAGKETAFLRESAAVTDYGEGIHLEAVVVVET